MSFLSFIFGAGSAPAQASAPEVIPASPGPYIMLSPVQPLPPADNQVEAAPVVARASAIAPKAVTVSAPPTSAVAPGGSLVTAALLSRLGVAAPGPWVAPLAAACTANEITTPLRIAAFLANVLNESGNLTRMRESLDYSSEALLRQWPMHFTAAQAQAYGRTAAHPANQKQIAELAYGGRGGNGPAGSGDGWLFRGAGGMETTFRSNYLALAKAIGWTRPVEDLPAYLETVQGACDSAAIFWKQAHCNVAADRGDITTVRRIVNGGEIGLKEVTVRYADARRALGL